MADAGDRRLTVGAETIPSGVSGVESGLQTLLVSSLVYVARLTVSICADCAEAPPVAGWAPPRRDTGRPVAVRQLHRRRR